MLFNLTHSFSVMESLPGTAYVKHIDIWLIFAQLIPFVEVILLTTRECIRYLFWYFHTISFFAAFSLSTATIRLIQGKLKKYFWKPGRYLLDTCHNFIPFYHFTAGYKYWTLYRPSDASGGYTINHHGQEIDVKISWEENKNTKSVEKFDKILYNIGNWTATW